MTNPTRRWHWPAAALIGLFVPGTSFADDTELFVTEDNAPISCPAPNVLFIIDTSGSMDGEVITQQPWDPDVTFAGCYRSDAVYFEDTATIPDCGSTDYILKENMFCDAFQGTEFTGVFQAWNKTLEQWRKLNESSPDWPLECSSDEGLHGDGTALQVYAVDGAEGPWSDQFDDRVAWGSNASAATLFDGNRLNWETNPPEVSSTRMQIVQEVTTSALDSMVNVNVGLMRFNDTQGGPVLHALQPLSEGSATLKSKINALPTDGSTPLAETLYEAGQYLAGRAVQFGNEESDNLSVAESRTGGDITSATYDSPLDEAGQTNYIVLLTDGEPSDDTDADGDIQSLPDFVTLFGIDCDGTGDGACLDDMAAYLQKQDLRPDVDGVQNVITHTIGFNVDLDLLETTAQRGGGRYFVADNTSSLTQVLADLAQDFNNTVSLLAAPGIPINSFSRTESVDAAYLSLFRPSNTYRWPGNLKRYRVAADFDSGEGSFSIRLVDALGNDVIDPDTNLFRNGAVSLWSAPTVDGGLIDVGGAASQLPAFADRNIYTDIAGSDLTAGGNEIAVANGQLTASLLGAPDAERDLVIEWARGADARDIDNDPGTADRFSMGDPLHVQPVTVDYGAAANDADTVVFIATNDGYLHAVRADTGEELWAYIPGRLLDRLYALSLDEETPAKQYGLDGQLQVIDHAGRKTLVFGMRRGGDALFALDITQKLAPQKLWEIDGSDSEFADLGQTWPTPVFTFLDGAPVIVLAGGYDTGQDNRIYRTDQVGNAIYIIDLDTGNRVWSAGSPSGNTNHDLELADMQFSFPAAPAVVDFDGNRNADHMYAADMGGQVWRFDLFPGQSGSSLAEAGVLASLGGAAEAPGVPAADNRRFYNAPDVVLVDTDEKLVVTVNIGSGYRAHPLDVATNDEFYSIRDLNGTGVMQSSAYGPPITRADLLDITDDIEAVLPFNSPGWLLRMSTGTGEKILGQSLTVANTIVFTSFTPAQAPANSCLPAGGINRLYLISVLNGAPLTNLDGSSDPLNLTQTDRSTDLGQGGIVTSPELVLLRDPDSGDIIAGACVGTDCITIDDGDGTIDDFGNPRRSYWYPVVND